MVIEEGPTNQNCLNLIRFTCIIWQRPCVGGVDGRPPKKILALPMVKSY